jgi:hypothetical protein
MLEAEARMRAVLASHSLADLTERVTAKAPSSYAIDIENWLGDRSASRRRTSQKAPRRRIAR